MTNEKEMKTYQMEIIGTMKQIIEVVAKDEQTALLKAQEKYRNEEVILYADDYIDIEYNVFENK